MWGGGNYQSTASIDNESIRTTPTKLRDNIIKITDSSISEISPTTQPQINAWLENYISSNWSNFSDVSKYTMKDVTTNLFDNYVQVIVNFNEGGYQRAYAYLSSLNKSVPLIDSDQQNMIRFPFNGSLKYFTTNDISDYFEESIPYIKPFIMDNISKLFINPPKNISSDDIYDIQLTTDAYGYMYVQFTIKNLINSGPITMKLSMESVYHQMPYEGYRFKDDLNWTFDIGNGGYYKDNLDTINSKILSPQSYVHSADDPDNANYRLLPFFSKLRATEVSAQDGIIKYSVQSDLYYSTKKIVTEPNGPVINVTVKGFSTVEPAPQKQNTNDKNQEWILYALIAGGSLIIIAVIITIIIVVSKKKKSKIKKAMKTKQCVKPVAQEVKTLPTKSKQ